MKRFQLVIVFIIITSFKTKNDFVHQDFFIVENYGNITTRLKTGFQYEEIKKVEFIGKYAEKLCKRISFKKNILLDFDHFYVDYCEPDYFISKGKKTLNYLKGQEKDFLENNIDEEIIVIRQIGRKFNITNTLKLIEYAVVNDNKIVEYQNLYNYQKNYSNLKTYSIDTIKVNSIINTKASNNILKVISDKITREETNKNKYASIRYFSKNGKFVVNYYLNKKRKELILEDVYDFKRINNSEALIFDTDSSFYYVKPRLKNYPKKLIIKNLKNCYRPFIVNKIDGKRISIQPKFYTQKDRTLIFESESQILIQDFDDVFKKHKKNED